MQDRRDKERISAEIEVSWRAAGPDASQKIDVHSVDLSETGMAFHSEHLLKLGSELRVEVCVTMPRMLSSDLFVEQIGLTGHPTDQAAFANAIVRSCCEDQESGYRIGIEFHGPGSDLAQSLLRDFINFSATELD